MEQNIIPVLVVCILFLIHYIVFNFETGLIKHIFQQSTTNFWTVIISRIWGFLLFFIIPYFLSKNINILIISKNYNIFYLILFLVFSTLPFILNFFVSRTTDNLERYPQMRLMVWNSTTVIISAITWILYLIGYEYMLRYYLFYASLKYFSLFTSILINVSIYSLIHIHKGIKEVLGSIIMGVFLCYAVYITGTFWTAVWFHGLLALSNEWFSIYYTLHPVKKNNSKMN